MRLYDYFKKKQDYEICLSLSLYTWPVFCSVELNTIARQCVAVCCSGLQWVAVCYRVLQCAAVGCRVLQCVAVCCSVLQCVAVCCTALQRVAACCGGMHWVAVGCSVLQCVAVGGGLKSRKNVLNCDVRECWCVFVLQRVESVAVLQCCKVLQRVAVCCSALQRVAVCYNVLQRRQVYFQDRAEL